MKKIQMMLVAGLAVMMAIWPQVTLNAARQALELWWRVVLPSLLPFSIAARLLLNTPLPAKLAALCEKPFRRLLGCSGAGAYLFVLGGLAGYPVGAQLAAQMIENGLDSREAQRMLCFVNNAGPLFLSGTLATALLGHPQWAWVLLISHYGSALLVGILSRPHKPIIKSMRIAQFDSQPWPQALGDAVGRSVTGLIAVGGIMTLFGVAAALLTATGLLSAISGLTPGFGISSLIPALFTGTLEITQGAAIAAQAAENGAVSHIVAAMALSGLAGWGGLSVHCQAMAFIGGKIKVGSYMAAKAAQGVLSAAITGLILLGMPVLSGVLASLPTMPMMGWWIAGVGMLLAVVWKMKRTQVS